MNKPIVITTADIYLRFPEIMEEEANDLAEFLEDEHIIYEGATDVFMEKDKEIERLNNIINEIEAIVYANISNIDCRISIQEKLDKLRELKGEK